MNIAHRTAPKERASSHDAKQRQAERQLTIPAVILLSISVIASTNYRAGDPITAWAIVWSAAYVLAFALLMATVIRGHARADELQKIVQLRAAAVSFGVTISGLFIAALLHSFNIGKPSAMIHSIFTVSILTWLIATQWFTRKATK